MRKGMLVFEGDAGTKGDANVKVDAGMRVDASMKGDAEQRVSQTKGPTISGGGWDMDWCQVWEHEGDVSKRVCEQPGMRGIKAFMLTAYYA